MRGSAKPACTAARLFGLAAVVVLFASAPSRAQSAAPPTNARQGDHKAQPFQASWGIPFDNGDGNIPVPSGKRLVFEFASIDVTVNADCRVGFVSVTTKVGDAAVGHHVPITGHHTFGTRNVEVTGQVVKLYADPETTANVNFGVAGNNCNPIGVISVSGYLEDVP